MKKKVLLIVMIAILITSACASTVIAFADSTLFDYTNVLDDLQGSYIEGELFDAANYPKTDNVEPRIMNLVEYAYAHDQNNQGDYGLYIYVYNPSGKAIKNTRNSVTLGTAYVDNLPTDFNSFELIFLTAASENVFLKFKVTNTDAILRRINRTPASRRYDIGELQLNYNDVVTAFDVGNSWTYSGYANGCGPEGAAPLSCISDKIETVGLETGSAWWRYRNNVNTQTTISSVYFGVPKKMMNDVGTIKQIKANWFETHTAEIITFSDGTLYNAFLPYVGVLLKENTWAGDGQGVQIDLDYWLYYGTNYPVGGGMTYDWAYNQTSFFNGSVHELRRLTYLFQASDFNVSSKELLNYIKNYQSNDNSPLLLGKYSDELFETGADSGRQYGWQGADGKGRIIDADVTFGVSGFNAGASLTNWFHNLFYYKNYDHEDIPGISPIYYVTDADVMGSISDIASRLFIDESEVRNFLTTYNENKAANKDTVLFRFAVTDYECHALTVVNKSSLVERSGVAQVSKETAFLDFDIIWLKFVKNDVYTTIPAVMNPIDIVGGLTPVPSLVPNEDGFNLLSLIVITLLFLAAVAVFIRLLGR